MLTYFIGIGGLTVEFIIGMPYLKHKKNINLNENKKNI